MQFENTQINKSNKQSIELPEGFEQPNHPDHSLYLYLQQNTQIRQQLLNQTNQIQNQINEEQNNEENKEEIELDYFDEQSTRLPNPGEQFRLTQEFIKEQLQLFQTQKQSFQKEEKQQQKLLTFEQWKQKIQNKPTENDINGFNNLQIIELLKYCKMICKSQINYSQTFIEWLYFLLVALEMPLESDTQSLLSSILKYICRARHALFDPNDPMLVLYKQIITIIGIYYGQSTEDDVI